MLYDTFFSLSAIYSPVSVSRSGKDIFELYFYLEYLC